MDVAWETKCLGTNRNMSHFQSDQEVANTNLFLHAVGVTSLECLQIDIHSPVTVAFVLALW